MLLTLRTRGYGNVLAVFGFRQEAQFVEKRLRQAGALGGIRVDYLAGREGSEFLDVGKPDLVLFFNPQVRVCVRACMRVCAPLPASTHT